MPSPASSLAELRSLVAAWNPQPLRKAGAVATGIAAIDETLGGGLPGGQLTEIMPPSYLICAMFLRRC